ncbi:MAG: ABC transporter ATP-binding protein [Candidatus Omnitrophota bacterium]
MMIDIKNLHKSFNSHKVLNGVDLQLEKGTTLVVIGRSGCGKSVMLKHIVGILKPDEGEILVDGMPLSLMDDIKLNGIRNKIGLVFQGGALFDSLNVAENVGFRMIEHSEKPDYEAINVKVKEALKLVDLSGIEKLMPAELSGGMKKRVSLARAICTNPEIILYDEPTTGLDPINADGINDLIRSLHDKIKVTAIVVTHDMKSAYKIADRIAMMYQGRIITQGTPEEIQASKDPVVYQFINGLAKGPITETEDVFGAKSFP